MNQALFYLILRSTKGRIRAKITRLKNPRYLIGAIIGFAYFALIFRRRIMGGGPSISEVVFLSEGFAAVAACILMFVLSVQWMLVFASGGLNLNESEMELLFPAPLSRRALIHYHLLKAQFGFLVLSSIIALFLKPILGQAGYLPSTFMLFLTMNVFLFNQTFLDMLALVQTKRWLFRSLQGLFALILLFSAIVTLISSLQSLTSSDPIFPDYALVTWVAAPFQWLVRGFVEPGLQSVLISFTAQFSLLGAYYLAITSLSFSFEEGTAQKWSKRKKRRRRFRREQREVNSEKPRAARSAWFGVSPSIWRVLVGKSAIGLLRYATKVPITYMVPGFLICWMFALISGPSEVAPMLGFMALGFGGVLILAGGRLLHLDFRTELENIELLKSFPVKGYQMVISVLVINCLVLGSIHLLLSFLFTLSSMLIVDASSWPYSPIAIALSVMMIFPIVSMVFLLLENLLFLWLPGWFLPEKGERRSRGFDVMGRRIFNIIIRFFGFGLMIIFPTLVGVSATILLGGNTGLLIGSSLFAFGVLAELVPAVAVAGFLYDRIDSIGDDAV